MARTNPKHALFVQQFVSGPDQVRYNATAAYKAAYPKSSDAAARRSASDLLTKPDILAAIAALHREAQAQAMARLRDWKEVCPEAQDTVLKLMAGDGPTVTIITQTGAVVTKADAAMATVMLSAAKEVLERGYPKALRVHFQESREELATMLGVASDVLPNAGS